MKKYPIAKPYIGREEKQNVLQVLNSGNLSLGPIHKIFEQKFAQKIGTKYACSVSSGTAGLHLAMIASEIKPGDEVITSPFSFISSANCILYVGAKPVFVDIDPLTCNMDPQKIAKAITKKTKAILVVHIFGQSADMGQIQKIAKKHKLKIIEDACESICATHKGKKVGTFGESAIFAFYPNKQMTTGEGGMVVTGNRSVYKLINSLRNQGRSENMQWLDHQRLGYNYRMSELSAALGIAQLEKLDNMISERKKIAEWYNKHLKNSEDLIQIPHTAQTNEHTWFVYVIKVRNINERTRNKIILAMEKEGIATKPYLPSIHLFSFYRNKFGYKKGDFPVAEKVSQSSIALPFYIGLKEKDIKYIVNKLVKTIRSHANQ